jgi:hypothetical protein
LWVIIALVSLFVLIILILCIPFDAAFRVDIYGSPRFSLRLVWLFGLVKKDLKRGKKKPSKRKPGGRRGARDIFKILRTKGLLRQAKTLVTDIFSRLKIRDLSIDLRVGLDDPADTGLLFSVIGPALLFCSPLTYHLRVQPSFEGEAVLEGYAQGAVRLLPIRFVVPFLRFTFSMAALRAVKTVVLAKWKRKK